MSQPSEHSSRSDGRKQKQQSNFEPETNSSWLSQVSHLWMRFDRFGRDILGIFLLVLGLITLLGLSGLTSGLFISPLAKMLQRWMGWGSFSIPIFLGLLGWMSLRRSDISQSFIRFRQILMLEGWVFIIVMILSVNGGHDLHRAEAGKDGGLVGWSLVELLYSFLPGIWGTILLAILLILFTLYGFGIWGIMIRRFEKWLETSEEDVSPGSAPIQPLSQQTEDDTKADQIDLDLQRKERDARLPPLELLRNDLITDYDENDVQSTAEKIEKALEEFGIPAHVVGFRQGPTVTQFAVEPGYVEKTAPNGEIVQQRVRVSQISALAKDLSRALSAEQLRIEAPVPGHSFVGIEVPNPQPSLVGLRSILESDVFLKHQTPLLLALGRDVSGSPVVADLARMPHLLVAGTTGSGKSICIAALTVCLVMNNHPSDLRLIMLDPKMVELIRFNGLPHLLGQVETETNRMLAVLGWALAEMDRRYRLFESTRSRDITAYNQKMERRKQEKLPRIVIFIDELADLMMAAPEQTETAIIRLAQMARATGIHLVVATQRPSTDIITGLIKANFPARIAFSVFTSVDSRVILDTNGAETLLGKGDMLFLNPEVGSPIRAQGVMVSDLEIEEVSHYWRETYNGGENLPPWEDLVEDEEDGSDSLIEQAIEIVRKSQRASASLLQRRLRIGYPRAARLVDELEEMGVVGPSLGGGREREVLIPPDEEDEFYDEGGEEPA